MQLISMKPCNQKTKSLLEMAIPPLRLFVSIGPTV